MINFDFVEGLYNSGRRQPPIDNLCPPSSSDGGTPNPIQAMLHEPRTRVSVRPRSLHSSILWRSCNYREAHPRSSIETLIHRCCTATKFSLGAR